MYPSSSKDLNKETEKVVYFFTPAFHLLDNFSAHVIHIWDVDFPTAEHAFHWKKFSISHPEIAAEILASRSPHSAQKIAHANIEKVDPSWYDKRVGVMEEILIAKAGQHEDVGDALKKTENREIIENSPVDDFWGCGPDGSGRNEVGKIWMKIRVNIKKVAD